MSVTACRSHHVDTWPWNESIITPGKCFCLFIFSHLHYPLLRCSQVASFSLRECTLGQPPSVSASSSSISQTQIHTYTNQSLSGQTWWERKKSRERIWVHDRPDSQIKVKAIAGCDTRARCYSILHPTSPEHSLCLCGFYITSKRQVLSGISWLLQIVLASVHVGIPPSRSFYFEMNMDVEVAARDAVKSSLSVIQ